MLEDGVRCSLCEIPEHHSTAVPVPPVPATPSTARRHARHHVHHQTATATVDRKIHSHHADIGDLRLHANHIRQSSSPAAAPVNDHKHHTLSQFTNLIYTPRHAINEEPIYGSRSRHAASEEPTFLQELSSYMKKNHHSYDGGSSRNLNNNDLNYNQNPNALSDDHLYGYSKEPNYKLNNLPVAHSRSRSNSYNSQILNPKSLYTPNSRLYDNSKTNTLPTNMLSGRRGSGQVSSMQDLDQDYFLNMPRSRFSFDGMKRRETKKQRITVQSVVLIGCFSLLFMVGIIMFVAVCYQNGWLGLGQEDPVVNIPPRRRNDLSQRYDQIQNLPDNVFRQRGAGSGRIQNDYPHIGLSGVRRRQPPVYEDRVYQQSPQFARRIGHQVDDNNHVNNHIEELPKTFSQSPQFSRLVDDRIGDNDNVNSPIDQLPQVTGPVDNHPISITQSSSSHDANLAREDLQASLKLAFVGNEKDNVDNMEQNINSERFFQQQRVIINVPHHTIELSHNENIKNIPASKLKEEVANLHGLETVTEKVLIDQTYENLTVKSDITHEQISPPSITIERESNPLPNYENTSTPSNLQGNKTIPLEALKYLLKDGPSRVKILNVVAGVLQT